MSAVDDQTRLTAIPAPPPVDTDARMNGFEVAVDFVLYVLPAVGYVALVGLTTAAGAVEMFIELGPYWAVLVTAGLIGAGIYGGTRLRLLPVVPVPKKRGSRG